MTDKQTYHDAGKNDAELLIDLGFSVGILSGLSGAAVYAISRSESPAAAQQYLQGFAEVFDQHVAEAAEESDVGAESREEVRLNWEIKAKTHNTTPPSTRRNEPFQAERRGTGDSG